jgi:hypothetical protein
VDKFTGDHTLNNFKQKMDSKNGSKGAWNTRKSVKETNSQSLLSSGGKAVYKDKFSTSFNNFENE